MINEVAYIVGSSIVSGVNPIFNIGRIFPSMPFIPIGHAIVPNIGFPYGWSTAMGLSYAPIF